MRATVLAVEDADFYHHNGVSAKSVLRALRANSEAGAVSQGGSTITQQLVKLSLVGDERTITRKVKEASLAVQLENQFCENTTQAGLQGPDPGAVPEPGVPGARGLRRRGCLAGVLQQVCLGDRLRRGGGAGLTHPEPQRATTRSSSPRWQRAVARSSSVACSRKGLITQAESDFIERLPLPTSAGTVASSASSGDLSYFERKVRDELLEAEWLAPTEELRRFLIFNGGLEITSTMDPRAQELAVAASASNPVAKLNPETVAVVASVEPSTGAVRAVVGETEIPGKGLVEVATPTLGRSPGSSFKPFTLIAALEEGHSIRSSISSSPAPTSLYDDWDLPKSVKTWPSGCKGGSLTLASATSSSNNCAYARLQASVGRRQGRRRGATARSPDDQ